MYYIFPKSGQKPDKWIQLPGFASNHTSTELKTKGPTMNRSPPGLSYICTVETAESSTPVMHMHTIHKNENERKMRTLS